MDKVVESFQPWESSARDCQEGEPVNLDYFSSEKRDWKKPTFTTVEFDDLQRKCDLFKRIILFFLILVLLFFTRNSTAN